MAGTDPLDISEGEVYYGTVDSAFYKLTDDQVITINSIGELVLTPGDINSDDNCFEGIIVVRLYDSAGTYKQEGILSDKELKCCLAAQYDKVLRSDCGCSGKKGNRLLKTYLAFKAAEYSIDCYNYSNAEDLYNKAKEMCVDDDCGCS